MKFCGYGDELIPAMPQSKDPLQDLKEAHAILKKLEIPHALTGGWAAIAWGVVRTTSDLDLLVMISHANRSRVGQAFEKLKYSLDWRKGGIDDPIPELLRMTPTNGPPERLEIDFILAVRGFELDALQRSVPISLGGWEMPVLRLEDLIAIKLSAGGAVDFQDAKSLLALNGKTMDQELLRDSCRRLKVPAILRRLQSSAGDSPPPSTR